MKPFPTARFGRLVVLDQVRPDARGNKVWVCRCDCGKKTFASAAVLTNGRKQSCGCLKKEAQNNFRRGGRAKSALPTIDDALEELEIFA